MFENESCFMRIMIGSPLCLTVSTNEMVKVRGPQYARRGRDDKLWIPVEPSIHRYWIMKIVSLKISKEWIVK